MTQVVSTTPGGPTMTGEVAELDVSADGSRVLIGKKVGEDADGNDLYDLYMHVGSSPNSVEVVDTASGVIFDGMTSDGTKVFFSTRMPSPATPTPASISTRADVGAAAPR